MADTTIFPLSEPEFEHYYTCRSRAKELIRKMIAEEKHPERIKHLLSQLSDANSVKVCIIRDLPGLDCDIIVSIDEKDRIDMPAMLSKCKVELLTPHTLSKKKKNGKTVAFLATGKDPVTGIPFRDVAIPYLLLGITGALTPYRTAIHHTGCPYENRLVMLETAGYVLLTNIQHGAVQPLLKSRFEYMTYFRHENVLTYDQLDNLMAGLQIIMSDMVRDDRFRICTSISLPELNLVDQRLDSATPWKNCIKGFTFRE